MKFLKIFGGLFLVLFIIYLVLCLIGPKNYELTRTRDILATPSQVYPMVANYSNWPAWSPWNEMDPSSKYTLEGADGTVGSKYSWVGDKTGEGYMMTTGLEENKRMEQDLVFTAPAYMAGESKIEFVLDSVGENRTKTSWIYKQDFGFLTRGMMTFMQGGMEENLTTSFDRGLIKMDSVIESRIHYAEL